MDDVGIALVLAGIFSILISIIEVRFRSEASFKACVVDSTFFYLYLLVLLVGNIFTTLLAAATLAAKSPVPTLGFAWLWYAFVGVFAFEALIQNINLTFVGKGVLTINDWISKARDSAVASAIKAQKTAVNEQAQRTANRLKVLSEQQLNTHVLDALGPSRLAELRASAQDQNVDVRLLLALALAKHVPEAAASIQT